MDVRYCLLPLLLLSSSIPALTSPIVTFITKNQFKPVKLLTQGLILTEKYVITTKIPLLDYELMDICIMPVTNLKTVTKNYISENCIEIRAFYLAEGSNICLLELKKEISFIYQVNPAAIPPLTTFKPTLKDDGTNRTETANFAENCQLFYDQRDESEGISQVTSVQSDSATIDEIDEENLHVTTASSHLFCVEDSGLPLYCNHAVVGMFAFQPTIEGTRAFNCERRTNSTVVNLLSADAQKFFKEYMKAN